MKNSQFLQNYQHLQYGIMYQELIDLGFASIAWCEKYTSSFFNHAQVNFMIEEDELEKIESELQGLSRKSAVYFEHRENLSDLKSLLGSKGYIKLFEDSWMFHPGEGLDEIKFGQVKKVETEDDLKIFLDTFNRTYQKDDPQNPYGELGDYLEVARDSWHQHHHIKIEYFIIYSNEKEPVAASTLTSFPVIGYISKMDHLLKYAVRDSERLPLSIVFIGL